MKTLRFYKEPDQAWYIDLPAYLDMKREFPDLQISKNDLQMILGVDLFLESISMGGKEVGLLVTTEVKELRDWDNSPAFSPFPKGWEWLSRSDNIPVKEGKYYIGANAKYMWFSPPMMFIFGNFPDTIFYKLVKN